MNIQHKKDHVILRNKDGEYHISLSKFNKLGEKEAIKEATKDIEKKKNSSFSGTTINFNQARELGFCEYGIKDFCDTLNLDIDKEYDIKELNKALTIEVFTEYSSECLKLFGKNTLKYIGGIKNVLNENNIYSLLIPELIPEYKLHLLSTKFAYLCLPEFEKIYPEDKRPRQGIEAKEAFIRGDIDLKQLESARSSARSARSSARSAAWSARASAR